MNEIIFIVGATAVGKSDVAVQLAKKVNAEVISADSMQIYRGMDIGTGKITESEKQGVVHHMIDIADINEDFSVGEYAIRANKVINEITNRNKQIIVVGGTGLYVNALINGMNFADAPRDYGLREKLKDLVKEHGNRYLHDTLRNIDPMSADIIAVNDVKRVIRAIEIYQLTGKRKSESIKSEPKINYRLFALNLQRDQLYGRIENRVDEMFKKGLIDEVKNLYKYKDCKSMQAIGYKEVVYGLDNGLSEQEMIDTVKQNSRRYAKRQLTYFRNMPANVEWVEKDYYKNILDLLEISN